MIRFEYSAYTGGCISLVSGTVTVGAVYPPALNGDDWTWRCWNCSTFNALNGRANSKQAAKNELLAAWLDFVRSAGLQVVEGDPCGS